MEKNDSKLEISSMPDLMISEETDLILQNKYKYQQTAPKVGKSHKPYSTMSINP